MNSLPIDRGRPAIPAGLRPAVAFCLIIASSCLGALGQSRQQSSAPPSELARQNMAHVAASVGQLIAILHRDPGLMVELKRWVAKDATDHGQLIADTELTDEAIFDRLETDTTFRAIATSLVQKYGYLEPLVNPESPQAKQEALLIQERVKWIAQEEEMDRANARQQQIAAMQQAQACNQGSNCPQPAGSSSSAQPQLGNTRVPPQVPGLQTPDVMPPGNSPSQSPRNAPGSDGINLLRTSDQDPALSGNPFGEPLRASQTDENGQPSGSYGRGASSGQSRSSQTSIADLSLTSDFAGEGFDGSPYGMANGGVESANYPGGNNLYADARTPSSPTSSMALDKSARESTTLNQRLVRRHDPYQNIPSLYDMYLQAATRPPAVERFGMEIFDNGTRDLQMLPTDLPVGPDYVIGTGDGLTIDLWGGVTRRFFRVVDREGRISLPEAGPVLVAGKTLGDVQELVQKNLRDQFREVSADVSLSRLRTIRIYVVGDVVRPGAYDIGSLSTPLNALFAAGGPTGRGSLRILRHYRGNQLVQDVDVYDLLLHGVKGDMSRLENGDTVMVPPLGAEITVEGMVRRPAIYEQKGEKSLADALALAGGLLPTATLRHIEVQRVVAHQRQTMLSLDVPQDDTSEAATKELQSFPVQDGDKIRIFPIAPYNQDAVYLEGHVVRPGKYSFHQGMKVTDLIASYKDLLPEPALQYGEIIRLSQPDFRPQVESFNVEEALADPSKAPELKPLDTVQFFGRYDFENPPEVSVLGDVRAPGEYRTSGDIHLSDAIHMAGGLLPDAAVVDAQVFRSMPDSTLKILNVKLSGALDGSPTDNIALTSRDRVLVHRNAAAADPSAVYIKGEVVRPGRYPLTADMSISDLVQAAGGLKQSADMQTADLTHYFWKDNKQISVEQTQIALLQALDKKSDVGRTLNNGDVLSIRQVQGWEDLGSSVTIRGEVVHPGSYGIHPGEKLSSVLLRAGGFSAGAYPYGSVLARSEVQKLEQRSYGELIQRVREQQATLKLTASSTNDNDQKLSAESALVQWQTALDSLMNSPPTGRVTIQISSNIRTWENSARDVTLRAGDVLYIPKRPSYVLVQGQVYGPTAVAYRPGKSAKWYLAQAGGPTNLANRRAIFVIHADGTVVGRHSSSWITGDALSVTLQPGDMVVAPEKALGGPPVWKTLFQNAQVLSSITTSAILAAAY